MDAPRVTITRSRKGDLLLFGLVLVVIVATGLKRLRVYFEAPPPAIESPR